ncbi:Cleavage and polyadenylation specificity factor subunit 6 [Schistosoma japonicum]|uniref:Cleavage and polyadenylation specificity factor subunit 6 n=3 Tax=Schistosoma japonicum TaxID=6182 RepID=C1LH25_SCHJA|nr:Cleavage and polyadenylation specificity factor subunit 6 [Schistosoma japonicum]KAH8870687.1 Cleavage and polyadenylation specificity factor subunit 6 [Schistosoma japonicum]CAX74002.1 cleavage and polyadenylation specific factor 6 [Schistosoma japonicum]CAX74003.1 cleavage and polyadenylation specific factor 6 [Schistosoma japonicum]
MAGDNTEIDLYDNIDEDFVQECTDLTELYDDVIAPIKSENSSGVPSSMASKHSFNSAAHSGRRVSVYVGNLTWWTTDLDLLEAAAGVGINDVVEIKFHENRQNGQSKGFCVMVFGSEQSMRLAMDKFPKIDLHGQNPVVTSYTKHNLSVFEKAAGSDNQSTARPRTEEMQPVKVSGGTTGVLGSRLPPPLMATPTMPASLGFSVRNNSPLMGQVVPSVRNAASLSSSIQQAFANHNTAPNLSGNSNFNQLPLNFPGPTSVLMPPSGLSTATLGANATGLLPPNFALPSTIATSLAANAHVNPNFLTQQVPGNTSMIPNSLPPGVMQLPTQSNNSISRPQFDHYGRPVIHTYTPPVPGKLSESEFEDILQRNKTVSSSAINRAVQDAAGGDYASAIETLVTAISLIKQSKIANDDRCRILINSLQDTLHGIESKSYGAKTSSRKRRRSYSDSGSDGEGNYISSVSGSNNASRRHRERNHRSRSRDRHDRHDRHDRRRHSRDRGSGGGNTYYSVGSNLPLSSGSGLSTIQSVDGSGQTCAGSLGSNSERYRDSRYRH